VGAADPLSLHRVHGRNVSTTSTAAESICWGEPRTLRGAPSFSIAAILQLPENKYDKFKWIGLTAPAGVLKSLYVKNCGNP
jgi:hypothetical protein